jgi:hypothetical protein
LIAKRARIDLPDGQINDMRCALPFRLSSLFRKNILIFRKPKSLAYSSRPVPHEGRFAIVTDAGQDAMDVEAPITNGAEADGEVVWS